MSHGLRKRHRETMKISILFDFASEIILAAMVVVVFGCGNLVTYAATGNNLVKQISVTIHGEKKTEDITKNPDGSYEYEMGDSKLEIVPGEVADDFEMSIEQETDQDGEEKIDVKIDNANSDQKVEFQEKQQNK